MSKNDDELWMKLCDEYGKALDAVREALADRQPGVYQTTDFWERLEKAQADLKSARDKLDEFRDSHES